MKNLRFLFKISLIILTLTLVHASAFAATIGVTIPIDDDSVVADSVTVDGHCTLREAFLNIKAGANSNVDCIADTTEGYTHNDKIVLKNGGTYSLKLSGKDDTGQKGDIDIYLAGNSSILTITTSDSTGSPATIDGSGLTTRDRIFEILRGSVTFENLVIQGGYINDSSGYTSIYAGAGIYTHTNGGTITLKSVTLQNNYLTTNSASVFLEGGAISSSDNMLIENSIIDNNQLGSQSKPTKSFYGAGIYLVGDFLTVDIKNSIINANQIVDSSTAGLPAYGAGIACRDGGASASYSPKVTITNSTINANKIQSNASTSLYGGGVYGVTCDVDFSFVTLTGNMVQRNSSAGFTDGNGGGFYNDSGSFRMTGVLIADNIAYASGVDCYSTNSVNNVGDNFIERSNDCNANSGSGVVVTGAVTLDALADNGGATQTIATEDVVSSVGKSLCADVDGLTVETDQRGAPRPSSNCAKGAYEPNIFYTDADGDGYVDKSTSTIIYSANLLTAAQSSGDDCDDTNSAINPASTEVCDEVDNNCDGQINEGSAAKTTYYQDHDGDGYGDASITQVACTQPTGYVTDKTDCNDLKASIHPGASELCSTPEDDDCNGKVNDSASTDAVTYYVDVDTDGYGNPSVSQQSCSKPKGYVTNNTDCNDASTITAASIHPGATEKCDGIDNNCNGSTDEGIATSTWYRDADGDTYGEGSQKQANCLQPTGYVANKTDCDDGNKTINPIASEVCGDHLDNNCDGAIDDSSSVDTQTFYVDADGDGYGLTSDSIQRCTIPSGYATLKDDCNDTNSSIHPYATEDCSSTTDLNCDGTTLGTIWYKDVDKDGYGDPANSLAACADPSTASDKYVTNNSDCNDSNKKVSPLGEEICNGVDDNCNGLVDDNTTDGDTFYADKDKDEAGDPNSSVVACSAPTGYVSDHTDCNDNDSTISPYVQEVCGDQIDNNCDDVLDDSGVGEVTYYQDLDGDTYGDANNARSSCSPITGYVADNTDCDDNDKTINPKGAEVCNDGKDNDCSALTSDTSTSTYYADTDGDGYGDPSSSTSSCGQPSGYVANNTDCNISNSAIHPNADEYCDGIDNNCDGNIDENTAKDALVWYPDNDGDGYGRAVSSDETPTISCSQPEASAHNTDDCDDNNIAINPAADEEVCPDNKGTDPTIDLNCNGLLSCDPAAEPVCGNSKKEKGEECDAGPKGSSTCSTKCKTIKSTTDTTDDKTDTTDTTDDTKADPTVTTSKGGSGGCSLTVAHTTSGSSGWMVLMMFPMSFMGYARRVFHS